MFSFAQPAGALTADRFALRESEARATSENEQLRHHSERMENVLLEARQSLAVPSPSAEAEASLKESFAEVELEQQTARAILLRRSLLI